MITFPFINIHVRTKFCICNFLFFPYRQPQNFISFRPHKTWTRLSSSDKIWGGVRCAWNVRFIVGRLWTGKWISWMTSGEILRDFRFSRKTELSAVHYQFQSLAREFSILQSLWSTQLTIQWLLGEFLWPGLRITTTPALARSVIWDKFAP